MKFMEKAKRFFTLNAANHEGFTLVELIVVIAILAILAGVAVPAYSGYIKKADRAADLTLLGAVNEAFAAACMNEGTDVYQISGAALTWNEGAITGVASVSGVADVSGFDEAFKLFYSGNTNTKFKVIKSLVFDAEQHVFVDPANVTSFTVSFGGNKFTVNGDAVQNMQNSTFGQMGGEALLGEVANLTSWASGDYGDIIASMDDGGTGSADFVAAIGRYMGYDSAEQFEAEFLRNDDISADDKNAAFANGLVLYAAENAATLNTDDIKGILTSGNVYANLDDDPATQLAQASLAFGMYTGYINSGYYKGPAIDPDAPVDPVAALKTLTGDDNFKNYVNSSAGDADLNAYISAMDVINSSVGTDGAMTDVLVGGFGNNAELQSLLQQVLGK